MGGRPTTRSPTTKRTKRTITQLTASSAATKPSMGKKTCADESTGAAAAAASDMVGDIAEEQNTQIETKDNRGRVKISQPTSIKQAWGENDKEELRVTPMFLISIPRTREKRKGDILGQGRVKCPVDH